MSVEFHVLLRQSQAPTAEQWQGAISESGFDLVLDQFSFLEHSGFLPATYKGVETGFEFDMFPASDTLGAYPKLSRLVEDRDLSANFRFGGDMNELVAAVIASAVLTKLANGVFYDPQDDVVAAGDEAIAMAKETIALVADNLE